MWYCGASCGGAGDMSVGCEAKIDEWIFVTGGNIELSAMFVPVGEDECRVLDWGHQNEQNKNRIELRLHAYERIAVDI